MGTLLSFDVVLIPNHDNKNMENTSEYPIYLINGCWSFNPNELTIQKDGQTLSLRKKNAEVLLALVKSPRRTITTESLYEQVWGGRCVSEGVITRSICDLRNAFVDDGKQIIVTVPKQGYRLAADVEQMQLPTIDLNHMSAAQTVADAQPHYTEDPAPSVDVQKAHSRYSILFVAFATMVLSVLACSTIFYFFAKQNRFDSSQIPQDSPLFIHEVMQLVKDHPAGEQMLDNLKQKQDSLFENNPQKSVLGRQLISAYVEAGRTAEIEALGNKLLRDNERILGVDHIEYLQTRLFVTEALLSAKQIQLAYEMSQLNLKIAKEHHQNNAAMMALSHYLSARVNLACVYPYCDRFEATASGLHDINKTIDYIQINSNEDLLLLADAKLLKNWFLDDPEQKTALISSALKTYIKLVGMYDNRTAVAYSQLGKIELHWHRDYVMAQRYLNQALEILAFLYDSNDSRVKQLKFELSWLYLEQEKFEKAIEHIAFEQLPGSAEFICRQNGCLQMLLVAIKAYMYSGFHDKAKLLASYLPEVLSEKENRLPFSLRAELKTVLLRVQNLSIESNTNQTEITNQIANESALLFTAKNDIAIYSIIHELQHWQLRHAPQSLDLENYLFYLDILLFSDFNSYMTQADRNYLQRRAVEHCAEFSEQLCKRIKLQSHTQLSESPPWLKLQSEALK